MLIRLLCAGIVAALALQFAPAAGAADASAPRPVIAVLGEPGINVLHEDFALTAAEAETFLAGVPAVTPVDLPDGGTFEERLAAARKGALGALVREHLYWVRGTRVLIYVPPGKTGDPNARAPYDVLAQRLHGTGVASAAAGNTYGTAPGSMVVFIPGTSPEGYGWLARQQWIDIASVSTYGAIRMPGVDDEVEVRTCAEAAAVRSFTSAGRVLFASVGNVDLASLHSSPNGLAEAYQVGGVDKNGRTILPPQDDADPFFAAPVSTRPYETGELYSFPAASPDALSGPERFGGTSGATPRTAGRAAALISSARQLLGSGYTGVRDGALARVASGSTAPATGPLADGAFTGAELTVVLHAVAVPQEVAGPARYLAEGYGALNDAAIGNARELLAGTRTAPQRADDDRMHAAVEQARAALFNDVRCG